MQPNAHLVYSLSCLDVSGTVGGTWEPQIDRSGLACKGLTVQWGRQMQAQSVWFSDGEMRCRRQAGPKGWRAEDAVCAYVYMHTCEYACAIMCACVWAYMYMYMHF